MPGSLMDENIIKKRVSVVVPVYNVEKYLRACVDSVLGQRFQELDVILIDDGSTDGSPEICDEYAEADPRVRVFHQKNRGLSGARNRGIELASGEYLYFLDSDDTIDPNAMDALYQCAESQDLDLVLFDGLLINEAGQPGGNERYFVRTGGYPGVYSGRELFAGIRKNREYWTLVQLLFIRKKALLDMALYFREGILHEDELFTFLLMMECKRCAHLPEPLFNRRVRGGSIMTTPQTLRNVNDCILVLEEASEYYRSHSFEPEVFDAIRDHMAYFFWNVYTRIRALSAKGTAETAESRKRLFAKMEELGYLHDSRISRRCRLDGFYQMRDRLSSLWRRIVRRISLVQGKRSRFVGFK